jgi:hypothetical protein
MSKVYSIAFVLMSAVAAACGSDDPITAIDRASDCNKICTKYKDCLSSDYDVDSCEDKCNDMVSSEDTSDIDMCRDCVSGNSCVGSAFQCAAECAGIVP